MVFIAIVSFHLQFAIMAVDILNKRFLMFRHPFTCIVAGPTGSGKTEIVRDILGYNRETIYIDLNNRPLSCMWCYGQFQTRYNDPITNTIVTYFEGVPTEDDISAIRPDIIIIDDLMAEVGDSPFLARLFTKESHHLSISVVFIVQNLFHQAKSMRNTSLNAQYVILMKNVRDKRQVMLFGSQMHPGRNKFFMESYEDATRGPFGYLLADFRNDTPDQFRLRARIVPENNLFQPIIYVPR
jgi:hypothetical protein